MSVKGPGSEDPIQGNQHILPSEPNQSKAEEVVKSALGKQPSEGAPFKGTPAGHHMNLGDIAPKARRLGVPEERVANLLIRYEGLSDTERSSLLDSAKERKGVNKFLMDAIKNLPEEICAKVIQELYKQDLEKETEAAVKDTSPVTTEADESDTEIDSSSRRSSPPPSVDKVEMDSLSKTSSSSDLSYEDILRNPDSAEHKEHFQLRQEDVVQEVDLNTAPVDLSHTQEVYPLSQVEEESFWNLTTITLTLALVLTVSFAASRRSS